MKNWKNFSKCQDFLIFIFFIIPIIFVIVTWPFVYLRVNEAKINDMSYRAQLSEKAEVRTVQDATRLRCSWWC